MVTPCGCAGQPSHRRAACGPSCGQLIVTHFASGTWPLPVAGGVLGPISIVRSGGLGRCAIQMCRTAAPAGAAVAPAIRHAAAADSNVRVSDLIGSPPWLDVVSAYFSHNIRDR